MLIVQKYGGSSVANAERVFNVAKRIMRTRMEGNDVVVVLSAQGKTTDGLIAKAKEINAKPSRREMDMLLSTGEQQSVALMAMAISAIGGRAVSLNAAQVGIETTNTYSNARIRHINTERIENELDEGSIVLVTGFQGVNAIGDTTTLGRGGSDTSAVALAAALNADMCEIYTDVEGVYTADPRVVPDAVKLDEISYDEMLELASLGAKVLHSRSVEVAKKYNVKLVVRSSMSEAEGTEVKEDVKMERMLVSGVAADKKVSLSPGRKAGGPAEQHGFSAPLAGNHGKKAADAAVPAKKRKIGGSLRARPFGAGAPAYRGGLRKIRGSPENPVPGGNAFPGQRSALQRPGEPGGERGQGLQARGLH